MRNFETFSAEDIQQQAHEYALSIVGQEPPLNARQNERYWDVYWDTYYRYTDKLGMGSIDETGEDEEMRDDSLEYLEDSRKPDDFMEALRSLKEWMGMTGENLPSTSMPRHDAEAIFFKYPDARREVYEFSKAIAEYLERNRIKDLVIADRSSRPLYVGVREYWQSKFPNEPMPGIYFVNPKGFKSKEAMTQWQLEDVNFDAASKDDRDESVRKARSQREIIEDFKHSYPKLMEDKNQPIIIFDTCIHSGDTLYFVMKTFKDLGFTDVKVGSVNPADRGSLVRTDFSITKQRPEQGCYPFDRDRLIEKTFEHVYSLPQKDPQKRAAGFALRKEIKQIMQEHLE